jgi:predicted flap endonuclease-1-like 5' DNA nuclease
MPEGGDQMTLLARMLCRWLGCPAPGPVTRERAAEEAEADEPPEVSPDDLTAIRGIGIATQNRLYRAGIKSYGQLARATPENVRKILGKFAGGASVEKWIAQAKQLANEGKS